MKTIALSGGVAYNHAIRETIRQEVLARGFTCIVNADYPLGDGCVSFGQCVYAGHAPEAGGGEPQVRAWSGEATSAGHFKMREKEMVE